MSFRGEARSSQARLGAEALEAPALRVAVPDGAVDHAGDELAHR
ncbi:MAG: hypothetical protein ACREWE_13300 [Gammaproteobacteria bacterium]